MSTRRANVHMRCPRCRIHVDLCFCDAIRPIKNFTNLSLIVHVRELTLTSNTAHFLAEMMPETTEIYIRGKRDNNFESTPILARSGTPLFLYPSEDSVELNQDFLKKHPGPYHLIVPDGSWRQARKVYGREEGFRSIPTVHLPGGFTRQYELRESPRPEWLSTFEATAYALGIIESQELSEELMAFFKIFVKRMVGSRKEFHTTKTQI